MRPQVAHWKQIAALIKAWQSDIPFHPSFRASNYNFITTAAPPNGTAVAGTKNTSFQTAKTEENLQTYYFPMKVDE